MKYKIVVEKSVVKFLRKHPELLEKFKHCSVLLSKDPLTHYCDVKKLTWMTEIYRLRIWKRRFLYKVSSECITIFFFDAWSRWDIYSSK